MTDVPDITRIMIRTLKDLEEAVETFGILPLFRNAIPGFSIEEHVAKEAWFESEEGVWEWKGPVIRDTGCAYGKFLGNKAVFISREFFPDFANWRRDGYDFDARYEDELASYKDKMLFDLLDQKAPIQSRDLKKAGNYGKDGKKGFDTIISRLQAQCYVIVSDFVYAKDRFGQTYGWGIAEYSTPEKFMGEAFTSKVYEKKPSESYARIFGYLLGLCPWCDPKTIEQYLTRFQGAERPDGQKLWLVPSNPKYYDVVSVFAKEEEIAWKQGSDKIRPGDIVYLYVGAPYSAILYRCEVTEIDIPYTGESEHVRIDKLMMIRRLEVYPPDRMPLSKMKNYDVVSVRCTRSMPLKLAAAL